MNMNEMMELIRIKDASTIAVFLGVLITTILQVAPIKINPWDDVLKWIGNKLNGEIQNQLTGIRKDLDGHIVAEMRRDILTFARQCRKGMEHSEEQWHHVLTQAKRYENYIESHEIENGAIEEETKYIRNLHKELCREGRI